MLGNANFYNRTTRKVVVAFGTMFNDISIVRFDTKGNPKDNFRVPLTYGAKEKYLFRDLGDPTLTKSVMTVVPRMSFILNSIEYDSSRKQQSTIRNLGYTEEGTNNQFVPVPYNFNFSMSIFVRNTEDGTQILEQILPFFTPDFTVTVDFIPDMGNKFDVPIILNSVTSNTEYEGDFSDTRLITWDLEFTAKAFMWPPVKKPSRNSLGELNDGLIRKATVNIHNYKSTDPNTLQDEYKLVNKIEVTPDPIDAGPDDEFGFSETLTEYDIDKNNDTPYGVYHWIPLSPDFDINSVLDTENGDTPIFLVYYSPRTDTFTNPQITDPDYSD